MDLIKACKVGNLEEVKKLEGEGADIHIGREEILRWAVLEGNLELVKFLVENGADVREVNIEELVSGRKYKDVLYLLLDRLSKEELMPLLVSSNNRLRKAVKAYLRKGGRQDELNKSL